MTTDTKRNQVVHHIVTELAPTFHVMDVQVLRKRHATGSPSNRTVDTASYLVEARVPSSFRSLP